MVEIGAKLLAEKDKAVADNNADLVKQKTVQLNKLAQDVKSVTTQLNSMETTYSTLKEAYDIALENYKVSSAAYEHAKSNGSGLLFAIKAHQDALRIRDNTRKSDACDSSFLNDLESELNKSQSELRADKHIDDAVNGDSILEDVENNNDEIYDEFKKAQK